MNAILAIIASLVLLGLSVFQILLVAGVPLGKFAWGGASRVLPPNLRIASAISVVLYAIFAAFILTKATVLELIGGNSLVDTGMWVLTAYFFLGIVMNGISRSKYEQLTMTPVALVLAVSFLIVAMGR